MLSLTYYVSQCHKILLENSQFEEQYSFLYEGINRNNSLAKRYSFINLFRKMLFIAFTIFFYEKPLI